MPDLPTLRSRSGRPLKVGASSPRLSRNLCILCQKAQPILVHYREICAFYAKKPDQLSVILSLAPLFSYTSPEVPSFLTSLWVSAPFLTMISVLVSRHKWRRPESPILCMNSAFSSFGVARSHCIGPRPFKSASGRWPRTLVYTRLLPLSSIKRGYTLQRVARTCF
jgi:hypothetical protein